jgi:RNA polymerase primary sigma factor
MDAPLFSESENNLYDVLLNENSPSPDDDLMSTSLNKEIERSLSQLGRREAEIIRCYFGLSGKEQRSLEEIATDFGLTKERVRQIKELTMKKMRHNYRNKLLKAYL